MDDVVSCDTNPLVTALPAPLAWLLSFVWDEEANGSTPALHHYDPRLVRRIRSACPLRCRIEPHWIKAAPIGQLAADVLRASRWCPRRAAKGRVVPIACGDGFVVVPFTMR